MVAARFQLLPLGTSSSRRGPLTESCRPGCAPDADLHPCPAPPPGPQGDLSLLAQPGGVGLPVGHIVAFQPDHRLQARFAAALRERATYRQAEPQLRVQQPGDGGGNERQ